MTGLAVVLLGAAAAATPCQNLTTLKLANTTITSAVAVPEGPPPARGGGRGARAGGTGGPARGGAPPANIPAHCRLQIVLKPTSDSLINMELWLPTQNWNGKFMGVGNFEFGGAITGLNLAMPEALRLGYATAGTDTGHQGPGGKWAIGHPEKMIDFAYRATHEMTVKSKQIIRAFYDQNVKYSYFQGCSTGGRMALMEAQRYPDDYDGIIARSPANPHIRSWTAGVALSIDLSRRSEGNVPAEKAALVNQIVMGACDTLKEGFLNNPRQCQVDFSKLHCPAGGDNATCLTAPQLKTVETWYGGVKNSKGELISSGAALGSPIGALPANANQLPGGTFFDSVFDIVRIAFNDPNLDWRNFDLDRDMPIIDKAIGYVDALNPDLSKFKASGGKLLMTHGWSDTNFTPETTVRYNDSLLNKMGKNQSNWMRLFMAPGMGHCSGGPGVNTFDYIGTLEKWVEKGIAPDQVTGTGAQGLTRPLCPYPQYAEYKGSGDLKHAANWACKAPPPEARPK